MGYLCLEPVPSKSCVDKVLSGTGHDALNWGQERRRLEVAGNQTEHGPRQKTKSKEFIQKRPHLAPD